MFCGIRGFGEVMFFSFIFPFCTFLGASRQSSCKALAEVQRGERAQGLAWKCGSVRLGDVQAQQYVV